MNMVTLDLFCTYKLSLYTLFKLEYYILHTVMGYNFNTLNSQGSFVSNLSFSAPIKCSRVRSRIHGGHLDQLQFRVTFVNLDKIILSYRKYSDSDSDTIKLNHFVNQGSRLIPLFFKYIFVL
jgi:hypothetical protein